TAKKSLALSPASQSDTGQLQGSRIAKAENAPDWRNRWSQHDPGEAAPRGSGGLAMGEAVERGLRDGTRAGSKDPRGPAAERRRRTRPRSARRRRRSPQR